MEHGGRVECSSTLSHYSLVWQSVAWKPQPLITGTGLITAQQSVTLGELNELLSWSLEGRRNEGIGEKVQWVKYLLHSMLSLAP